MKIVYSAVRTGLLNKAVFKGLRKVSQRHILRPKYNVPSRDKNKKNAASAFLRIENPAQATMPASVTLRGYSLTFYVILLLRPASNSPSLHAFQLQLFNNFPLRPWMTLPFNAFLVTSSFQWIPSEVYRSWSVFSFLLGPNTLASALFSNNLGPYYSCILKSQVSHKPLQSIYGRNQNKNYINSSNECQTNVLIKRDALQTLSDCYN